MYTLQMTCISRRRAWNFTRDPQCMQSTMLPGSMRRSTDRLTRGVGALTTGAGVAAASEGAVGEPEPAPFELLEAMVVAMPNQSAVARAA